MELGEQIDDTVELDVRQLGGQDSDLYFSLVSLLECAGG